MGESWKPKVESRLNLIHEQLQKCQGDIKMFENSEKDLLVELAALSDTWREISNRRDELNKELVDLKRNFASVKQISDPQIINEYINNATENDMRAAITLLETVVSDHNRSVEEMQTLINIVDAEHRKMQNLIIAAKSVEIDLKAKLLAISEDKALGHSTMIH